MSLANRGRSFETLIDMTNAAYRKRGLAVVDKVPTPWVVNRRGAQVIRAFPEKKSTVDYVGVIEGGFGVAFEAKSTNNKTRFDLERLEDHQRGFLIDWQELGGIAFLLVNFEKLREVYLMPLDYYMDWFCDTSEGARRSIPYARIAADLREVTTEDGFYLHYLKQIERGRKNETVE